MSVRVILSFIFKGMIGVDDPIEVRGKTVEECLSNLSSQYPLLKNDQSTYPQELGFSVADGDEIRVTLLLAGANMIRDKLFD